MEKVNKVCFVIILCIVSFAIGYTIGDRNDGDTDVDNGTILDTAYNKVVLDSIEYNVCKKDSIIVELKKRSEYEMEQAINADDSVAVKQFEELAGGD